MTSAPPPPPVRYGSRYGTMTPQEPRSCPVCATRLPSRRARYCSEACKQRAYRLRQAARARPELPALTHERQRLRTLRAHTLCECPTCGERYRGLQRCPDCQHFCRSLGLGGACPHCDELLLVTDVLD
jgi:hypothetical protein